MKKPFILFIFVFLALVSVASAQKVKDTAVTSTIENADQSLQPFRIQSDNLGAYRNGTESVVSRIQPIGDWELSLFDSATRLIFVNFGDPVDPLDPANGAPANGYYSSRFLAQCSANLLLLTANTSQNCKLVVGMEVGTDLYQIRFGYVAGTTQPLWTCKATSGGKCSSWRLATDPNGAGKNAAQLYKITTVKGKRVETPLGKYYFSLEINVATQ